MNTDILKFIVVSIAFLYLNLRIRRNVSLLSYWIMNIGLLLLLCASVLDFADGIQSLNNFPVLGRNAPLHDVLEDQVCDTPGLALFIFGVFKEILRRK